jgi:hypothetical protein
VKSLARPHWEPLAEQGKPRPELRDAMRGKAGVYLLRLWKTILRHFQACTTRGGRYSFGDDNFCDPDAAGEYEIAVMLTAPSSARELERQAVQKFNPIYGPPEQEEVPF